jgi:hypothetical protein
MKNPTLLTLLKHGCTITFPSDYSLTGDVKNKYINLITPYGKDGLRDLSRKGVLEALQDEKIYRQKKFIDRTMSNFI